MKTEYKNHWITRVFKYTFYVIFGILGATALALIFGYAVMYLWNWLMPDLFGLTTLTFWKAVGVVVLARLIFGGFKHGSHSSGKPPRGMRKKFKHDRHRCGLESCHNWKYYDQYWEEEGNKAFESYIKKKKEDKTEE